ncbi:MAG: phosphotransacetylase family protein [Richelia sp.]|nr:phosphotransacetylase family protein [Richelia sp.]
MPHSAKYLLIGSTEAYSGKSATVLGLSYLLQEKQLDIGYGKPLGTCLNATNDMIDEDVEFITNSLKLPEERIAPTVITLDEASVEKRLRGEDKTNYQQALAQKYLENSLGKLVLLEGPGNLTEGGLFDLSLLQVSQVINATVILLARYHSLAAIEPLLAAKQLLGERLIGVVINDVPEKELSLVESTIRPFLEKQSVPLLGVFPQSDLLRSVSVRELVQQLHADVLCCHERLDLMVESLAIGAMNVNSAVKYFRKRRNMAVVTGGDRVEIQQAALETSTQCLILTGKLPPPQFILSRAEELEIPILSVDLDTLTTVEIVDHTFGQVKVHEPVKVKYIRHVMAENFDVERLIQLLGFSPASTLF